MSKKSIIRELYFSPNKLCYFWNSINIKMGCMSSKGVKGGDIEPEQKITIELKKSPEVVCEWFNGDKVETITMFQADMNPEQIYNIFTIKNTEGELCYLVSSKFEGNTEEKGTNYLMTDLKCCHKYANNQKPNENPKELKCKSLKEKTLIEVTKALPNKWPDKSSRSCADEIYNSLN
ncbi:unnamed protein product [Blepharisma stoltei]|uniref:Uncharacterized protein n=1 Tax=Blepharisma stoltei TaxID=1481888 RepID=A0AAU9J0X3_9CILI|nr:unnamed protein product [Blepharisma stoltei]